MRWPLLLTLLAACGRSSGGDAPDAAGADASTPDADNSPDADPSEFSRVYAHSGQNLYRIDTSNLDVIEIGPFNTGGPSITDIAVDKNDVMLGVSLSKIWDIDTGTGAATEKATFQGSGNLTSLSFVPVDPDNPDSDERLVTATDQGDVYEINPETGVETLLGNYGMHQGEQIRSSGDIVSVRGLGTFATVTVTDALSDPDLLAEIDTDTWDATPIGTATTGYDKVFGLGYWGGTFFGFVDNSPGEETGTMITIDSTTGVGTPATTSQFRWYGAGVTTDAPIVD